MTSTTEHRYKLDFEFEYCTPEQFSNKCQKNLQMIKDRMLAEVVSQLKCDDVSIGFVESLLGMGAGVNMNNGKLTPLINSINNKNENLVKILIDAGADVNMFNPLMYAIKNKQINIVKILLEAGANTNSEDQALLKEACKIGNAEIVSLLLEKGGVDIRRLDGYENPLYLSFEFCHDEVFHLLLKHGADINYIIKKFRLPLRHLCENGKYNMIKTLLEAGMNANEAMVHLKNDYDSDSDECGEYEVFVPSISVVVENGSTDIVKLLIEHGADVSEKIREEDTLLCLAIRKGHVEVAKALIGAGANIDEPDNKGVTPLMLSIKGRHEDIFKELMARECDIMTKDENQWRAIHYAAGYGNDYMTKKLLEAGADVNDGSMRTSPLLLSVYESNIESFRVLIENGADMNFQNDTYFPLYLACQRENEEMIEMLIKYGADVNARRKKGDTAIMKAAETCTPKIINLLVNAGADIHVRGEYGETPLSRARQNKDGYKNAEFLLRLGAGSYADTY